MENKHTRDLAVSSMKLTDLSGNEVESVIKGQKYKLTYTFKNVGEEQTASPINSGLYTNNLQGQYYSDSRNLGNNVSGANIHLLKGQENTFTVEIDIPLNTNENMLSLYSFIPVKYDNTGDNVFIREDDIKKLEVPIKSPSGSNGENLAIVDIKLFNHKTNQEYNVENKDGTFNFDLNKSYRIEVKVQKTAGTAVLNNPELILNIRDSYGNVQEYILKSSKSFKNVGDTIIFKTGQFVENGNLLDVHAKIPSEYGEQGLNDISTDDQMVKTWQKSVNLSILSAEIIPNRFVFSENADNPPIDLPFKTTFGIDNTDNEYIEPALATIHNSNNKIVFSQRDISFTEGQTLITYYGTIPNQQLKDGNNPYKFTINYDRNIFEYDGTDNPYRDNSLTANVFVERKKTPQKEQLVCDSYNKENNWSVTFKLVRRNGYWTTKTIKTESGTETIEICRTTSIDRWEETRSYYERFGVEKIMFRSPSTIDKYNNVNDGWVDILGNNKGIVRAGQWYEFFVITRYNTNRVNIPAVPYGECGGSRTPNLSSVYSSNLIQLKMEGYGDSELHMLNSYDTKGSWSNLRRYFRPPLTSGKDAMGETTTRRYLPVTAENGRIDISIITQSMNGYYYDQNHSREKLQDCVSASIYIQNPLNLRSQTIGGD
ncbi:hypothetical protein SDC9_53764 [bioreactor metagenome]|uniref:Uncharacterized protein n=1 Tax=bioreactor metagenome TaxID=1076179 RepID=A0A644WVD4_9ZZZZ